MARRHYLVEGGKLQCDKGSALGEIIVTSQQKVKIKGKYKATNKDKTLKPPFFGSCACANNSPCSPILQEWKQTSKKSRMGNKTFVMKDSQIECSKGGTVTVKDVGQTLVGTGKEEPVLDKKYAKLQGEIIFANGYLSASLGGALNALFDLNPDEPDPELSRGQNANENDPLDEQNILLSREVMGIENMTPEEIEADRKSKEMIISYSGVEFEDVQFQFPINIFPTIPYLPPINAKIPTIKEKSIGVDIPKIAKPIPLMTQKELREIFWGYWNEIGTLGKGSKTYADHFNAGRNQHFLNGSHGLASNAAHRIDHGIAQGYHWAKFQWGIIPKEEVEATKEKIPFIKSYSPGYKPVTVVMHSQGNAPGAGFALGVLKYASELGWKKIPLNLIYLGVHQPQNLWDDVYDKFLKAKVKHYIADSDFWDTISTFEKSLFLVGDKYVKGGILAKEYLTSKKDKNIYKYLNGISELFSPKHHKLRHKRGIFEHLKAITSFDTLNKSAVQFTFNNDRADIVCRDGDIPKIESACNPKIDKTLYSVEFLPKGQEVPEDYTGSQGKEVIAMENGGHLVIPPYSAIQRLKAFKDNSKLGGVRIEDDWASYRSIAIDWGNAMSTYKKQKKEYQKLTGQKLSFLDIIIPPHYGIRKSKENFAGLRLKYWFRKVIFHYARIQIADLYAHFSPVEFINNKKILKNSSAFNDSLGNDTIWERIKKTGEQKFYRVEFKGEKDESKLSNEEKEQRRIFIRDYVEGEGKKQLINTGIADNAYITNVIKAYVHKDTNAKEQLYDEPDFLDVEKARMEKKLGLTGKSLEDKQQKLREALAKKRLQKIDKVAVKKPEFDEDLIYHDPDYYDESFAKLQKMLGLTGKEFEEKQRKHQEQLLKKMQVKQDNIKEVKSPKKFN